MTPNLLNHIYYAAFVIDPEGYRVEAVINVPV